MENDGRLPIIKSFFDPQALAQHIAKAYALSNVGCQLIKATMRDVYHVKSNEGDFVSLIYRAKQSEESIIEEIEVTDYLASQGFPVVSTVRQSNGAGFFTLDAPEGIRYAILLPYVRGMVSRQPTLPIIERYGALIAELHQLTDNLPVPLQRPIYDAEMLIARLIRTLETMVDRPRIAIDELRSIADHIYPMLQALPKSKPMFGIIHGDVIPSNALITPQDTLTLIDFDLFGTGWRTYDIASYLNEIDFWQMGHPATTAFLESYHSLRPLSKDELQILPLMRIARHFSSLHTAASNVNTWGSSIYLSDRVIDAAINSIRELYTQLST